MNRMENIAQARPRRPKIAAHLEIVREAGSRVTIREHGQQRSVELDASELAVLPLLDGMRSVPAVLAAAAALRAPLDARVVLSVVRRLDAASLLVDLEESVPDGSAAPLPRSFAHPPARRRLLAARVNVPGTAWMFAPGAWLGVRGAAALGVAIAIATVGVSVAGAAMGRARLLFDPFAVATEPGKTLATIYVAVVAALSARGLARGLALRAMKLACGHARLAFTAGFVHLDADDAARRVASVAQRLALAASGWLGIAAVAAASGAAALLGSGARWSTVAGAAFLALLADASPYLRTDGYEALAIAARTPSLSRRSASWLVRRCLDNLMRRRPGTDVERRLALAASAWIAHAVLAEMWIATGPMRGAAELARRSLRDVGPGDPLGLLLLLCVLGSLLAVVVGVAGLLAAALVGTAVSAVVGRGVAQPSSRAPSRSIDPERLAGWLTEVPAIAALDERAYEGVVDAASLARFPAGAVLRRQGERESRFVLVVSGSAVAESAEESGIAHRIDDLGVGAWFGQSALLRPGEARTTIRATSTLEAIVIDGDRFREVLAREGGGERSLALLSTMALLRAHPALSALGSKFAAHLLADATTHRYPSGASCALPYATGVWLVREGRGRVSWSDATGTARASEFGPSQHLDLPLDEGTLASARIDVEEATTLLRVDATSLLPFSVLEPARRRLARLVAVSTFTPKGA